MHVSRQTFPPCFPFLPSLTFISRSDHTLHLTPYTLHPTPYTLHPTPHTLHPTPYTLHPQPYTLHQSGRCASRPKRAFTLHSRLVWKYVCRTISGFFSLSLSHSLSLSYTHTHTHTHTHTLCKSSSTHPSHRASDALRGRIGHGPPRRGQVRNGAHPGDNPGANTWFL